MIQMIQYKVTCSLLRIRTQPTINSKCVGFYETGEMIYTGGEPFKGDDGRVWIRYFGRKTGVSRYVCYHENNGGQYLIQIKSQSTSQNNSLTNYKNVQYSIKSQKIINEANLISSEEEKNLNVDKKNQKEAKNNNNSINPMGIEENFKSEKNDIKNFEKPNILKEINTLFHFERHNISYEFTAFQEIESSFFQNSEINKMINFNDNFQQNNMFNPETLLTKSFENNNSQQNNRHNPKTLLSNESFENNNFQQNNMFNPETLLSKSFENDNFQQNNRHIPKTLLSWPNTITLLSYEKIENRYFCPTQIKPNCLIGNQNGLMKGIKFECFLKSRPKHDKFSFDNMMKRVKSLSNDIIIDILNIKLNEINELKKHFFHQIKILKIKPDTNNPTKNYYLNLLNRTLRQILSSQVTNRFQNKNDYNKNIIDKIYEIYQKEKCEIIKDLIDFLNMKYLEFWEAVKEYLIRRNKNLIYINEKTNNNQFLSSLIEEFIPKVDEYLTKKNENETYKIMFFKILEDVPSKIKNMKGEVKKNEK